MNIKSIGIPALTPTEVKKAEVSREAKTIESQDRDAHVFYDSNKEEPKRKLTDEEIQEAIKYLENLPFMKDNNWVVRFEKNDLMTVVFVEDSQGKVIRRIPEQDLWGLVFKENKDQNKGNLLNKAM